MRGNFLSEKTVSRGGGNASRRGVRLEEVPAVFEISHDVANGGGAKRLVKALGNGARRHRLARLDVGANDVGQNLSIAAFL